MNRREFLARAGMAMAAAIPNDGARAATLDPSCIGANTALPGFGLLEAIQALRDLAFPAIEIHPFGSPEPAPFVFPGFQFDSLSQDDRQKIRAALGGFRHITTHLPFQELHFFSRFAPIAEFSTRQLRLALEATAFFGATVAVAHATPPSWPLKFEDALPQMVRRFREWGDIAEKGNFKIAIETSYPGSVREHVRLLREIDHACVGCAIDVGHQIGFAEFTSRVKPGERSTPDGIAIYNDVMHELIDQLGPKVIHFHVHDVDRKLWKDHRPIGAGGVIDYPRLLRKLRRIDYRGLLVLEIESTQERAKADFADSKRRLEEFMAEA